MDAEKILPIALGVGIVGAILLANRSSGPSVITTGGNPDPAVLESVRSQAQINTARINAVETIASKAFDYMGASEMASSQYGIARLAADRDVTVALTASDRDKFLASEQTRQESIRTAATIKGYDIQGRTQTQVAEQERKRDTTRQVIETGGRIIGDVIGLALGNNSRQGGWNPLPSGYTLPPVGGSVYAYTGRY